MFISKFNKVIKNKIVWGCFAFMVAIAFIIWGTQTGGESESSSQNGVGMLDGKEVSPSEFRHAFFNSYLSMCMMFGRPMQVTKAINQALKKIGMATPCYAETSQNNE